MSSKLSRRGRKRRPLVAGRLELERLEDRIVPSITLLSNYPGMGFASSGGNAVPPDTQGAAGPNSYVETVNLAISIYSPQSTGSNVVTDQTSDFFFTQGGLPHVNASDAQSDTFTIFDPQVQRFIVGEIDFQVDSSGNTVNNGANALLLGVSKSANPATLTSADWYFDEVTTTETGVALQDYPGNVGYNADALVITLNSFSTTADLHTQVNAISMNSLINGTPLTAGANLFQTDLGTEFLPRPAVMPDSAPGSPMWMVAAPQGGQFTGAASSIDVVEMSNVLSANPTYTTTTLSVNPYDGAVPAVQPNGQQIPSTGYIDSRILKTADRSGTLVATQTVSDAAGDLDNARWYAINVGSGTPVLQQQGDVGGGSGVYDIFPGIDINAQGDIGMSFMQTGTAPGQYLSVYVTGRTPTDAAGTMEAPLLVQAGAGNYVQSSAFGSTYRLGDMSGINVDASGNFWIANEYANTDANANWGTDIANFTLAAPLSIVLTSATEGQALTNVPVATFIDNSGAPLGSYTASIDWGDGTITNGQVVATGTNTFVILGSHTYLEEGNYTLTVSENNGTTTLGPVSGTVSVADAPLTGSAQALSSEAGGSVSNTLVAIFTDTDTSSESASNYTATIQWFEGNGLSFSSSGSIVSLFGNTFSVYGNAPYTFPSGGLFTVRVVIRDLGGAVVTVDSVINVAHNPAIPPLVPMYQSDTSPVNASFVAMEDALTNVLKSEQLFLFAFHFGTKSQQMGSFGNLVNAFMAYQAAIFQFDMQLPGA